MCFYVHEDHKEKKIAEEDIVCYKIVEVPDKDGIMKSLHMEYLWEMDRLTSANIRLSRYKSDSNNTIYEIIHEGLHSYSEQVKIDLNNNYIEVECIIPKGSEYYYSPSDKEYVSNQLIIIKKYDGN